MSAENAIQVLAQKYSLEEGKGADWYQCHQTHCITKKGAEKLKAAEGITFTMPQPVVTECSIAFIATFTDKAGNTAHEIGSCRWDGRSNNPEKTHAPEMAWKRLIVRGVISLTAPSQGIYGVDELTAEYKQHGQAALTMDTSAPQQAQQPVAQTVSPSGQVYVDGQAVNIPPPGTQGWFANAEKLPQDWSNQMGRLCELTKEDRSKWERKLMDDAGAFDKGDGSPPWVPSSKYGSFNQIVFDISSYQGETKSKAGFAFKIYKTVKDTIDALEHNGFVEINVPNGNGGMQLERIERSGVQQQLPPQPQAWQGVAPPVPPSPTYTPSDLPGGMSEDVPF